MTDAAERFFAQSASLAPMPEVASKLLASLADERASLGSLAALIGKDPALSAKVLRAANSARFGPGRTASTIAEAAAALGISTLRELCLAAALIVALPKVEALPRLPFWRHSLRCSGYAKMLARPLKVDPEAASLAGLLLRSGEMLMALADPGAVSAIEAGSVDSSGRLRMEQALFGCAHADVTACMAKHWRFPSSLTDAFEDAARPADALPFSPLAACLRMAEAMADAAGRRRDPVAALGEELPELCSMCGVDLAWLADRAGKMPDFGSEADFLIG